MSAWYGLATKGERGDALALPWATQMNAHSAAPARRLRVAGHGDVAQSAQPMQIGAKNARI